MKKFIILRLDGPMQAWGTHTFEDQRPTNMFPTRSGLLGLIGACLGIDRRDMVSQKNLAASVEFCVRVDNSRLVYGDGVIKHGRKGSDFHTVLNARKVDGSTNTNAIVSRREYLFDAVFTVAAGEQPNPPFTLDEIAKSLRKPVYTPTLGRRSCPIAAPISDGKIVEASDALDLLAVVEPVGGLIYSEGSLKSDRPIPIRDSPRYGRHRQFDTRRVYMHPNDFERG